MSGFTVKRDSGLFIGDVDAAPTSGTIEITENGTHNVATYEFADVDVPTVENLIEHYYSTYTIYEPIAPSSGDLVIGDEAPSADSLGKCCFANSIVENVYVPDRIKKIVNGSSRYIDSSITLRPYGINSAFGYCKNLKGVYGTTFETIGDYSFVNCANLENISFENFTRIGDYAFAGDAKMDTNVETNRLYEIGLVAFGGCKEIASIKILGVDTTRNSTINQYAFIGCTNISKLVLNASNSQNTLNIQNIFGNMELQLDVFAILSDNITFGSDFISQYATVNTFYTHLNQNDFNTWLTNLTNTSLKTVIENATNIVYEYVGDGSEL